MIPKYKMPTPSSQLPFDVAENLDNFVTQSNDETVYIAADSGAGGGELIQIVGFNLVGNQGSFDIISLMMIQPPVNAPVTSYNIYNNGTLLVSITDPGEVSALVGGADWTIPGIAPGDYNITITGVNSNGEGLPSVSTQVTVS